MAVQPVAVRSATAVRPMIAGEAWLIRGPAALAPLLKATLGHLPQWQVSVEPVECTIRSDPAGQTSPGHSGTVQGTVGKIRRQEFPGARIDRDSATGHSDVTLYGPDPLATAVRTEVLARLIMQRGAERGLVALHGAAIGTPDGGYWVIPAHGGTGKSTATAAAAAAGATVLGDDLLLWDPHDRTLHGVTGTIRLLPEWLPEATAAFAADPGHRTDAPVLQPLWERHDGKVVLQLPTQSLAAHGRLRGLLLIGPQRPLATPGEAMRALSSSMFQLTRVGLDPMAAAGHLGRLVRSVPIRSLQRDPDLARWSATLGAVCGV